MTASALPPDKGLPKTYHAAVREAVLAYPVPLVRACEVVLHRIANQVDASKPITDGSTRKMPVIQAHAVMRPIINAFLPIALGHMHTAHKFLYPNDKSPNTACLDMMMSEVAGMITELWSTRRRYGHEWYRDPNDFPHSNGDLDICLALGRTLRGFEVPAILPDNVRELTGEEMAIYEPAIQAAYLETLTRLEAETGETSRFLELAN